MSWLFSQALVEEFSAASCLDGEPSALLSGNPIPKAYCAPDKMTAFSRLSRFGMTFKPLTESRGEELLTLYLAGFHAKTSAAQEREQELPAADQDSGLKWQGLLAKYNHATRSWKTAQSSLLADLEQCLEIWPRWGLMRNGVSYQQQTLVRHTLENESGLWPTVTATANQLAPSMQARYKRPIWMTPTVSDAANRAFSVNSRGEPRLLGQVKLWPTPQASDNRPRATANSASRRIELGKQISLEAAVKFLPTPTSHNAKETGAKSQMNMKTVQLGDLVGGSLNPTWVEKLMGWPDDWTSLQPMSHVKMCFWLMGSHNGTETGRSEVLRVLRIGNAAQEIQREIGRPVGVYEAALLLAELCEHANRPDEARVFMACAKALEEELRGVQLREGTTGAPHRPRQNQQRAGEHPDSVQALSRFLAHHGQTYWQDGRWEDATPRVANGVAARVDRLKAIGNGQVPGVAATAWRILNAP
jgi:hypothetical protein